MICYVDVIADEHYLIQKISKSSITFDIIPQPHMQHREALLYVELKLWDEVRIYLA